MASDKSARCPEFWCEVCGEPFDRLETAEEYGDLLDHYAHEHSDTEAFRRVTDKTRCWNQCLGCGNMFPAPLLPAVGGFGVRSYCDACLSDEPLLELMSRKVDGETVYKSVESWGNT